MIFLVIVEIGNITYIIMIFSGYISSIKYKNSTELMGFIKYASSIHTCT